MLKNIIVCDIIILPIFITFNYIANIFKNVNNSLLIHTVKGE